MLLAEALRGVAGRLLGFLAEEIEHLLEVGDLLLGLVPMVFDRPFHIAVLGLLLELPEHLQHDVLGAHRVGQLMHEQVSRRVE